MNIKNSNKGSALFIALLVSVLVASAAGLFLVRQTQMTKSAQQFGTHENLQYEAMADLALLKKQIKYGAVNRDNENRNTVLVPFMNTAVGAEPTAFNGLPSVKIYNWYKNSNNVNVACPSGWFRVEIEKTHQNKVHRIRTYISEYSTFAKYQGFVSDANQYFIGASNPLTIREGVWHTNEKFGFIGDRDHYWPQQVLGSDTTLVGNVDGTTFAPVNKLHLPSGSTPNGGAQSQTLPPEATYDQIEAFIKGGSNLTNDNSKAYKITKSDRGIVLSFPNGCPFGKTFVRFAVNSTTNEQMVTLVNIKDKGNGQRVSTEVLTVPDNGVILITNRNNGGGNPNRSVTTWLGGPDLSDAEKLDMADEIGDWREILFGDSQISKNISLVTVGTTRMFSGVTYGEYQNGTWVPAYTGGGTNGPVVKNPNYTGNAIFGFVSEGDILFSPFVKKDLTMFGSYMSRNGSVKPAIGTTWEKLVWSIRQVIGPLRANTVTTNGGWIGKNGHGNISSFKLLWFTFTAGFLGGGNWNYDQRLLSSPPPLYPKIIELKWYGWEVVKGR